MGSAIKRRQFTVDEYHRMGKAGILPEYPRTELLCGTIIVSESISPRHASTVERIADLWRSRLGRGASIRTQNPVTFREELSEPEPDVAVFRHRADFYRDGHPGAADTFLVIEVADSSLRLDRRIKMPLYARAGIAEAWLVDLTADRVDVYRAPTATGYQERLAFERGTTLSALAFPDITVAVDDLLG
jgi:Uma2 family endonuclease